MMVCGVFAGTAASLQSRVVKATRGCERGRRSNARFCPTAGQTALLKNVQQNGMLPLLRLEASEKVRSLFSRNPASRARANVLGLMSAKYALIIADSMEQIGAE